MGIVAVGETQKAPISECFLAARFMSRFRDRYMVSCPRFYAEQGYEMDVIGLRHSMFVDEIEIKLSRADFLADFKKSVWLHRGKTGQEAIDLFRKNAVAPKHELLADGELPPNYFAFLMPPELASQCEDSIPDHAGLYTFKWGCVIEEVKPSPRLHTRKLDEPARMRLFRKMATRYQYKFIDENQEAQPNPPTEDKD